MQIPYPLTCFHEKGGSVRNRSKTRFFNGVVSAFVIAFFLAHSLLGGLEAFIPLASPPALIMWSGIGIVVVHIIASIFTSR